MTLPDPLAGQVFELASGSVGRVLPLVQGLRSVHFLFLVKRKTDRFLVPRPVLPFFRPDSQEERLDGRKGKARKSAGVCYFDILLTDAIERSSDTVWARPSTRYRSRDTDR